MNNLTTWGVIPGELNYTYTKELYLFSIDKMDTVFLYLMDGKKQICYWKGDIKQFKEPEAKLEWLNFKNDPAIGAVKDDEKGMIQFKMSIVEVSKKLSLDLSKAW